jgi:hypothetical protein
LGRQLWRRRRFERFELAEQLTAGGAGEPCSDVAGASPAGLEAWELGLLGGGKQEAGSFRRDLDERWSRRFDPRSD